MDKDIKNKLINLLKTIYNKKIREKIKLVDINKDEELIIKGIMMDDEHTCYHDYNTFEDIITGLMVAANNYGIYYEDKFIGIISVFYHYYKDLTRLEFSISIQKEYRNKGIGK